MDNALASLDYLGAQLLGDPEVTANIYCKSCNLSNADAENYSTDLLEFVGHPAR